jgi:hypothetical protein
VEDAAASLERGAEAAVFQHVGTPQGEPLVGPVQRQQVRVLAVRFANNYTPSIYQNSISEIWTN